MRKVRATVKMVMQAINVSWAFVMDIVIIMVTVQSDWVVHRVYVIKGFGGNSANRIRVKDIV